MVKAFAYPPRLKPHTNAACCERDVFVDLKVSRVTRSEIYKNFRPITIVMLRAMSLVLSLQSVTPSSDCSFENCTAYCAGSCPFMPNISTSAACRARGGNACRNENMTVYRMTPWNVTDVADHDTGDIAGDMVSYAESKSHIHPRACTQARTRTHVQKPKITRLTPPFVDRNRGSCCPTT